MTQLIINTKVRNERRKGNKMDTNTFSNNKKSRKRKVKELLVLILLCMIPLIIATGCGLQRSYSCSACGSKETYTPIYASGVTDGKIEYKSCVGPGGLTCFGLNTKCWPTECLSVKYQEKNTYNTGCIYYYNGFGCISDRNVRSHGEYARGMSCGFINCDSSTYQEDVNADGDRAYTGGSCLGCTINKQATDSNRVNNRMPRQYPQGCVSACYDNENK